MKKCFFNKPLATMLAIIGLGGAPALADDTQLFMLNPTATSGLPNVLFVWDNTANWNTVFTTEKQAMIEAFAGLDMDTYNVGLMMFTETGNPNSNTDGGYVRAAIRKLSSTYRTQLGNLLNGLDIGNDKSNGGKYGLTMWEAWQYFNGLAPSSGNSKVKTDYTGNPDGSAADVVVHGLTGNALASFAGSPYIKPPSDGCQKNYIIFISNGPAADNNSDTTTATTALSTAGGSTTAITLSPSGSQENVADEWARFMANHQLTNREKVYTYTIDVNPGGTGQGPGHSALLKSMASSVNGKGKYYCYGAAQNALGDECRDSLTDIIDEIFKEILAVNSVFASVTLPVNVNVRGRQLNQVYMGLFRPDGNGQPLWPGNLKAYKVGEVGTTPDGKPIFGLTDQGGAGIENLDTSSSSYGFIKPNAQSFWSHTTATGFWDADYYPDAQGVSGVQDSPDGEMVEKGGAAQRLRDFYSDIAGSGYSINDATNGRKLYTCTGALCTSGEALSQMPFSTGNADLTDTALGLNVSATVTLARSGTTVTATATAHPFVSGDSVTISGATETDYNGTFVATKTGNDTFTYQIIEAPLSPATGTILVSGAGSPVNISSIVLNADNTSAVVTTAANHGLAAGASVLISGSSSSAYNKSFTVQTPIGANTFTISGITVSPASPATAVTSGGVQFFTNSTCTTASGGTYSVKTNPSIGVTRSGTTVTVSTTANLPGTLPSYVGISGVTPSEYNGCYASPSKIANKEFTYTLSGTSLNPQATATGGTVDAGATSLSATITRSGTTATVTTAANHSFSAGQQITVSGADQSQYNGSFTVASVGSPLPTNTLTYTVTTAPTSPATGTITAMGAGSGITASTLIDWVRGINVLDNDNPNPDTDENVRKADVRGYLHGDVLHSRPAVINYNRTGEPAERDIVIYYGANDGFLHAVKGGLTADDGRELWGFIAPDHFAQLKRLYSGIPAVSFNSPKPYFFDGPLSTYLKYAPDNSDPPVERLEGVSAKAYLYAAMRRGGDGLYALNILSPTNPILAWKINSTTNGFGELGQSWSEAKVSKIQSCPTANSCTDRPVLIFGAGYDTTADDAFPQGTATKGRGIYIIDALDGSIIWMAGPTQPANFPNTATFVQVSDMTYSIPSDLAVVDRNGDGYVDRIYAPDTGGNVWRVNLPSEVISGWTVGKFASLRTEAAATGYTNHRKFLFPPDIVFGTAYDAVLIGSGDREHPFDMTTENRFYMLKDSPSLMAASGTSSAATITEATTGDNICDVTNNLLPTDLTCDATDNPACTTLLAARAAADSCLNAAGNKGWYIKLCAGEKVVNTPITLAGAVNFGTNVPPGSSCLATANNQCSPSTGEGRLYFINYKDGTPLADTNASGTYTLTDRYHQAGGGFPPSGTQITTEVDGQVTDIVCSGSHCLTPPGSVLNRRYRVYWKTNVDVAD